MDFIVYSKDWKQLGYLQDSWIVQFWRIKTNIIQEYDSLWAFLSFSYNVVFLSCYSKLYLVW